MLGGWYMSDDFWYIAVEVRCSAQSASNPLLRVHCSACAGRALCVPHIYTCVGRVGGGRWQQ